MKIEDWVNFELKLNLTINARTIQIEDIRFDLKTVISKGCCEEKKDKDFDHASWSEEYEFVEQGNLYTLLS